MIRAARMLRTQVLSRRPPIDVTRAVDSVFMEPCARDAAGDGGGNNIVRPRTQGARGGPHECGQPRALLRYAGSLATLAATRAGSFPPARLLE